MASLNPIAANHAQKLLEEAYDLRVKNLQRSKELATEALRIGRELEDLDLIGKGLNHLSLFQMILGEYSESVVSATEAIQFFTKLNNEKGIADARYSIAGVQYKTDDFHKGLINLMECLMIYKRHKDYHNQARVLKSMGTIYEYFGDEKRAIESYESAIEAGKLAGNEDLKSNALNPLSGIYLNNGQAELAMEIIQESVAIKEKTGDIRGLAFSLYGRGKVFARTGNLEKAEKDFLDALDIHERMGDKLGVAMTRRKLGSLYKGLGNLSKAKEELRIAKEYSTEYNIVLIKFKACYELYEIAKMENDLENALKYLEEYIKDKESVINIKALKIIESYDALMKMENLEQEAKTEREKAEIIEQKNQDLDAFFYRVSHDLKGPITSLLGLDLRMREEITDEKTLGFLDQSKSLIYRMNSILDELIKITRLDHGNMEMQQIHFESIINECIQAFNYSPNFSKIKFDVDVQQNLDYISDWSIINTILQNLIENSIKYGRYDQPTPSISVKVRKKDKFEIIVEDNGMGISEEVQSKMFQMFYRGSTDTPGSGLGLFILKRAVEKLQGEIKVQSKPGQGTSFQVLLP